MSFEATLRATEILLCLAYLQQCAEHMVGSAGERRIFAVRAVLCVWVLGGVAVWLPLIALCGVSLVLLHRYQGPYNGGSDRMGVMILWCLTAAHLLPEGVPREIALGYLGVQVILSYVVSGLVKLFNPDWRSGRALVDVFAFSAYPVSERLRRLARRRWSLFWASWAVIVFEVAFPLALISPGALLVALAVGAAFHLANACLFGLNRFLWVWIAAYPSLLWLQGRML